MWACIGHDHAFRARCVSRAPRRHEARDDGWHQPQHLHHLSCYLNGANPKNRPYQLDYFLATPSLRERLTGCWADPDSDWMAHSDHRAIFATFDL